MKGNAYLAAVFFASCLNNVSGQNLRTVVGLETQSLLTGNSPQIALGPVDAKIVEDNLEIKLTINAEKCYITESHICNVPTESYKYEEAQSVQLYNIPIETIFDFVCMYETDMFIVAGHATVECSEELVGLVGAGEGGPSRRLQSDPYTYQAYYEIPIICDDSVSTTREPLQEATESSTSTSTRIPRPPLVSSSSSTISPNQ